MMKKMFVSLALAIVVIFGLGTVAYAKEVRTTTASALAEETSWTTCLDVWTQTEYGNRFTIHRKGEGFVVIFDYKEDLGSFKGAKLQDAIITYEFDSMNNDVVDYLMTC